MFLKIFYDLVIKDDHVIHLMINFVIPVIQITYFGFCIHFLIAMSYFLFFHSEIGTFLALMFLFIPPFFLLLIEFAHVVFSVFKVIFYSSKYLSILVYFYFDIVYIISYCRT
jgi:hypothetical protein